MATMWFTLVLIEGGRIQSTLLKNYFHRPNTFQGCLRVWSKGHQVRGQPCKLGNLATFIHANVSKWVDRINPLFPIKYKSNENPIKINVNINFLWFSSNKEEEKARRSTHKARIFGISLNRGRKENVEGSIFTLQRFYC